MNNFLRRSLRKVLGKALGKAPVPTARIIDSQSVKTTEKKGSADMTVAKKIKGRKRHILVDHLELLVGDVISAANCGERDGLDILFYFHQQGHLPKKVFADQRYKGEEIRVEVKKYGVELETVKRREKKRFVLEAQRWVVERTFAWLGKFRRLSKDY